MYGGDDRQEQLDPVLSGVDVKPLERAVEVVGDPGVVPVHEDDGVARLDLQAASTSPRRRVAEDKESSSWIAVAPWPGQPQPERSSKCAGNAGKSKEHPYLRCQAKAMEVPTGRGQGTGDRGKWKGEGDRGKREVDVRPK